MANDQRDQGHSGVQSDDEAALSARLRGLGERLDQVRASRAPSNDAGAPQTADPSAIARGFRLSAELVAGVLVGFGIGWLLDRWLGTSPWGLMVFLMLGFVGGVLNVVRSAGVMSGGAPQSPSKGKD